MGNFTIYHSNRVLGSVLSGGSWDSTASLEYMRDPRPTRRARSTDLQLTSTKFKVSMVDPLSTNGVQIIATNLSSGAKYKLTWYSDPTFTTQSGTTGWVNVGTVIDWNNTAEWLDWLNVDFWIGAAPFVDPDNYGKDIRHVFEPNVVLQYVLVEFDDTSNPHGYIDVGHAFFGDPFTASLNISYTPSFSRRSLTSAQESASGAAYFSRRGSQRQISVAWGSLLSSEVLGAIDNIALIQDVNTPVYVDLDPSNTTTTGQKTAFLARISQMPEIQLINAFIDGEMCASIGFEFKQVM